MAKYSVLIPCTLSVDVTVEADSEEEALSKALDVDFSVKIDDGADRAMIHVFEAPAPITRTAHHDLFSLRNW
jgi:hypothetical protein